MKKLFILILLVFSTCLSAQIRPTPYDHNHAGMPSEPTKTFIKVDKVEYTEMTVQIAQQDSLIKEQEKAIALSAKQLAEAQAKNDLFGGIPPVSYLIGLGFFLLGTFVNTVLITRKGIKKDPKTPSKFSMKYWLKANQLRVLRWIGTLAIVFILMRFSSDIFLGTQFSMFYCFMLGLVLDKAIERVKKLQENGLINTNVEPESAS